jgi:23S rRNA (adenine2030-N6)-methyltransferase
VNYRHAFHAGNFADVLKHVVLVRILVHLRLKATAFRVIETHAGAGRYDLSADSPKRTGEWHNGIGRLSAAALTGAAATLIEPYLALVRAANADAELKVYPGSPAIAAALTRPQDRLTFYELHPDERAGLSHALSRDRRVSIIGESGWTAFKAALPPPERRGLVLIDPPFEDQGELHRMTDGLAEAHRRWATGVYLLWYPIKHEHEIESFVRRVARLSIPKILRAELTVGAVSAAEALAACGVLVVNPPWRLEQELAAIAPALARTLGRGGPGRIRVDWLAR